jgi:hypothetical protein
MPVFRAAGGSGRRGPQGLPLQDAVVQTPGASAASGTETVKPDASSTYSARVGHGTYEVRAYTDLTRQGETWRLPLHPTDNSGSLVDSRNGATKDFQWKLTGLQPDGDPNNREQYYGGYIEVTSGDETGNVPNLPEGTTLRFTLAPTGPLIDGSSGETVTRERTASGDEDREGADSELFRARRYTRWPVQDHR